jgi:hypothetical protein
MPWLGVAIETERRDSSWSNFQLRRLERRGVHDHVSDYRVLFCLALEASESMHSFSAP